MTPGHSDKESTVKYRNLPKLTPEKPEKEGKQDVTEPPKQETPEERMERISNVQISFSDFFIKCVDHQMLKLFFLSLIFFFFAVGMVTCLYLVFIYFFHAKMWYFYFPDGHSHSSAHGEL